MVTSPLSRLFGRSPIGPIQQHMVLANQCAQLLIEFLECSQSGDWETSSQVQAQIKALEEQADELKREIRRNLPSSLFLPVARTDLLELLRQQDKIANSSRDVCGLMLGRRMRIPEAILPQVKEFVAAAAETAAQALQVIQELDELFETGFAGRETQHTEELIHRLDEFESRVDALEVNVRAGLFAVENDLPPVQVMFLYGLIDEIGEMADRAQRVGARLQMLMAK